MKKKQLILIAPHEYPADLKGFNEGLVLKFVEDDETKYIVITNAAMYTMIFEMLPWAMEHGMDLPTYNNAVTYPFAYYQNTRLSIVTKDSEGCLLIMHREEWTGKNSYVYALIKRNDEWSVHS